MERQLRLCDCNRSFAVDEKALAAGSTVPLKVHHELCRREIGEFESALACGDVLVGCTQEAALFAEVAAERPMARIDFFNLRENAGWSAEGRGATPKMAALIAAAMLPEPEPVAGVTLAAGNQLLIVGEAGAALGWAERLAARFDVSVLLTGTSRDAELRPSGATRSGPARAWRSPATLEPSTPRGRSRTRSTSIRACAATPASAPVRKVRLAGTTRSTLRAAARTVRA